MKTRKALSKQDTKLLDKAIQLAGMSTCRAFFHGAVISHHGKIVAVGVNRERNDAKIIKDAPSDMYSVHAEVAALMSCRKTNLDGAVIYVARVNKHGKPMMSKPCPNCQKALKARGIKKVCYTIDNQLNL
jgi:deoxycytidylate deaminase